MGVVIKNIFSGMGGLLFELLTGCDEKILAGQAFCQSLYFSQTCNLQAEFVYILSAQSRQTTQFVGCKFD